MTTVVVLDRNPSLGYLIRRLFAVFPITLVIFSACTPSTPEPAPTPLSTFMPAPTWTPSVTHTSTLTATRTPALAQTPTRTPRPSDTSMPTRTPTLAPRPTNTVRPPTLTPSQAVPSTSQPTSNSNFVSVTIVGETSDTLTLSVSHANPKAGGYLWARVFGCDESQGPCAHVSGSWVDRSSSPVRITFPVQVTLKLESRAFGGNTTQIEVGFSGGAESDNAHAIIDYFKWWSKP